MRVPHSDFGRGKWLYPKLSPAEANGKFWLPEMDPLLLGPEPE
jgi:hypothetical protein